MSPLIIVLMYVFGCQNNNAQGGLSFSDVQDEFSGDSNVSGIGGSGVEYVLQIPIPKSESMRCTQGVDGSYSHTATFTKYDLDFDTPNNRDEELFAPVSGKAFVHTRDPATNFGNHINFDLGNGTYVVLAHMKKIFVSDGDEVMAGQLVGYEGCTGFCTGDHIHIGLHRGDPALQAQYGVSIEAKYLVQQMIPEQKQIIMDAEDFECSLENGQTYRSTLPVTLWHPNGTLVKHPDKSTVYRIDDSRLRPFVNEGIFTSYGYNFDDIVLISSFEDDCFADGFDIDLQGMVLAARAQETGELWLFIGDYSRDDRYRIKVRQQAWQSVLLSWGLSFSESNQPEILSQTSNMFVNWPVRSGYVKFRDGSLIREQSNSTLYVVSDGSAFPFFDWNTYLLLGFFNRSVIFTDNGALEAVQGNVGSCTSFYGCVELQHATNCGFNGWPQFSDEQDEPFEIEIVIIPLEEESDEEDVATDDPEDLFGDEFPDEPFVDEDEDGFSTLLDCDDMDPNIHPGVFDECGDDIDQDCNGEDSECGFGEEVLPDNEDIPGPPDDPVEYEEAIIDNDLDGYSTILDCNDDNWTIHPGATDACGDGIDQDCNGEDEECGMPVGVLTVNWRTPFDVIAQEITLSGEYTFASGSYGFTWRELKTVHDSSNIFYSIPFVGPSDQFRFSVEYTDSAGNTSWSCIGPFPPGTMQGFVEAQVDELPIVVEKSGDPSGVTTGCGFTLIIP
ncbi:MAG: MopE-related protein [Patescibacteria group bacterium]